MKFDINEDFRVKWYPKLHLTAADLGDGKGNYRSVRVKLKNIRVEQLMKQKSQKKEDTPVAYFEKGSKYMILSNAVCAGLLAATGSAVPKDWIGKEVELYVETGVKAFGKTTDQVRVRKAGKANQAQHELDEDVDENDFVLNDGEVDPETFADLEEAANTMETHKATALIQEQQA